MARKKFADDALNYESNHDEDYVQTVNTYLATLNKFAATNPKEFTEIVCKSVLMNPTEEGYPFQFPNGGLNSEQLAHSRRRFTYLAGLLLRHLKQDVPLPSSGFVSIRQYVEADANFDTSFLIRIESPVLEELWWDFFEQFDNALGQAVASATLLVHQGVPIYQQDSATGHFFLFDEKLPLYHYICQRGKWFDVTEQADLPGWLDGLYFKVEDIEWHRRVFHSYETDEPEEEDLLRRGLRQQIGLAPAVEQASLSEKAGWPWGEHDTGLLRQLAAAGERFWKNYDPGDPTTAPKNVDVISWLVSRGVARRNAEVMATLLRDEAVPTGPRN